MQNRKLPIGTVALLACQWEVTAPKPGNVHRGADFDNTSFSDFLTSAAAIAPVLQQAAGKPLGETVLSCIQVTQQLVRSNTNLGIVLLLAPLASVPAQSCLQEGVPDVLKNLSADDAQLFYEAIRLASPGGLGTAEQSDIHGAPPADLLAAMQLAAERDDIALQYVTEFQLILAEVVPMLLAGRRDGLNLTETIIRTHLQLLSSRGDSLIGRKCGSEVNRRVREQATFCLQSIEHGSEAYLGAVSDFDFWLRADGRKRNPGTTADLIAAGLFAVFRDDLWPAPWA